MTADNSLQSVLPKIRLKPDSPLEHATPKRLESSTRVFIFNRQFRQMSFRSRRQRNQSCLFGPLEDDKQTVFSKNLFVQAKVRSGRFASPDEAITEAVRLLQQREEAEEARTLAGIRQGLVDMRAG